VPDPGVPYQETLGFQSLYYNDVLRAGGKPHK
jgi:hypothetical protein